ncbi:hypothetical protein IWW48_000047 [Coemansia sp. RSA 1200]|nr:hypothetical protein IWW48_000047 [Coemansia sp. RSA 1200]
MTPNSIEQTPTKPSASGLNSAPIDDLTAMLSQGSVRRQNSENKNRRSAASGHIRTTPMVQKVGTEIPIFVEESDRKLREKRSELARQLAGRHSELGLFGLIEGLEVSKEYLEFLDSSLDVFDGIAKHVPSLINNKLVAQPSGKALVNSKLIPKSMMRLGFTKQPGDNVLVTTAALDSLSGILFKSKPMCTKARLIGRLAFIVQTVYDEKKAVVKFSWTPANRLSEGAAYDILHGANVPHIPMVYDSGILKKDVFGYRLEYIVMEDCGHELFDFGQKYYKHGRSSELCHVVSKHIAQVSSCLVRAQAAGLLHRDISSGNIAVNASKHASVIDWGYAKVFRSSEPGAWERTERILQKWHLDPANTVEAEAYHDNMTGTPHYMSVQILLNNPKRGLIHDLESLFYAVLHALSDTASGTPPGFRLFDSHSLAAARIGFLTERDHFYKPFGVSVHERLRNVLDAMYCFLFTRNGQYIGGKLLYVEDFERDICKEHAEKFIDSDTLSLMMSVKECSLSTNEDMEVLTPPKRRHPDDEYADADSPDNKHMRT